MLFRCFHVKHCSAKSESCEWDGNWRRGKEQNINQHWILRLFASLMVFGMSLASSFLSLVFLWFQSLMFQSVALRFQRRIKHRCVRVWATLALLFIYYLPQWVCSYYMLLSQTIYLMYVWFFLLFFFLAAIGAVVGSDIYLFNPILIETDSRACVCVCV